MSFTIPSDTHVVGDTGHTTHHNNIADVLTALPGGVHVNNTAYAGGADPTGSADSTAAFAAALAALPTITIFATPPSGGASATFHYGTIRLGAGTYKLGPTTDIGNLGPFVSVIGPGSQSCKLAYYGTGKCLSLRSTIKPSDDTFDDLEAFGGSLNGFTVDGTNAGNGAVGLDYGDLEGGSLGPDLYVQNFAGTGSAGIDFNNVVAWTENIYGRAVIRNCTNSVKFRVNGGDDSFEYNDLTFKVYALANQNGVVLSGGANYSNGSLKLRANHLLSGSAQSSAALTVTGQDGVTSLWSQFSFCRLDVQAETDGSGAFGPTTVSFGNAGANAVYNCVGILSFGGANWTLSNWSVANSFAAGNFFFMGEVNGDTNIAPSVHGSTAFVGALIYGTSILFQNGGMPLGQGDFLPCTLNQNMTVAFQNTTAGPQRKTIVITQAASGGPYTVTWPANGSPTTTSPNIIWPGGMAPQMSSAPGAVDAYFLETMDGATWYGRAMQASAVPDAEQFTCLSASYTGSNVATAQKVFNATANGAITLAASTTYEFEGLYNISTTGATSHQLGVLFGGTATLTSIAYTATSTNGTTAATSAASVTFASVATVTNVTAAVAAATNSTVFLKGTVRVNAAGTFIPQFQYSAAPGAAPVVAANSYFRLIPVGSNTVTNVGNWS
jgi:hypothetical protein